MLNGGDDNDYLSASGYYYYDERYYDDDYYYEYYNYASYYDFLSPYNIAQSQAIGSNTFNGGGTAATTSDQLFIYDNNTGVLYFDQDGSNSGFNQRQIAQISGSPSLSANNFIIV